VPVTTTEYVPLVVICVGTLSVAVPDVVMELGETEQVTPDGQPEDTLRFTVPLKPLPAVTDIVLVAVPPAPTLCPLGEALNEKSLEGGPEAALNVARAAA